MATLILIALFATGVAVMLQGVAGVQVLFFKGADLLVLVRQAQVQLAHGLVERGVTCLLALQGAAGSGQSF
ncbi:hypothetical protein D9M70_607860 [compost metagenome]